MYAKLENGILKNAPNTVLWNNRYVNNPSEEKLKELDYLPVTYTDMPTNSPEGQYYEPHWEQTETEIIQVWSLVDDHVYSESEPELTIQDILNAVGRGLE